MFGTERMKTSTIIHRESVEKAKNTIKQKLGLDSHRSHDSTSISTMPRKLPNFLMVSADQRNSLIPSLNRSIILGTPQTENEHSSHIQNGRETLFSMEEVRLTSKLREKQHNTRYRVPKYQKKLEEMQHV